MSSRGVDVLRWTASRSASAITSADRSATWLSSDSAVLEIGNTGACIGEPVGVQNDAVARP